MLLVLPNFQLVGQSLDHKRCKKKRLGKRQYQAERIQSECVWNPDSGCQTLDAKMANDFEKTP